ncbi:nitroreductase [Yersinia frederiksenii]|nr:nitroreductase [Yersinia frederiksenii]
MKITDPFIFIAIINGKLILWDYRHHNQYEINSDYIKRIKELANGDKFTDSLIDKNIMDSKILDGDDRDMFYWGWDCLSKIFHIGTQVILDKGMELPTDDSYEGYVNYCASIADKIPELDYQRSGETIPLPNPDKNFLFDKRLMDTLFARKTSREFKRETVSLQEVAEVLFWTFGTPHGSKRTEMEVAGLKSIGYRRTSPSGGSLQTSEAYLVALNIIGLASGIYHYQSHRHELTLVSTDINGEKLGSLLCAQMFAKDLAFGIFITSCFKKMWWKYPHSRAYRVALFDIGCLVQTFQLITTAMQLGSWPTGYFLDREINKLLGVNEVEESVMFFLGAGPSSGSSFSPKLLETIKRQNSHGENNQ